VEPSEATDSFQLFFNDTVLKAILKATKKEANSMCLEKLVEHIPFTLPELKAFISLVIIVDVAKGRNKSIDQLWSNKWGKLIAKATMSKARFKEFFFDI